MATFIVPEICAFIRTDIKNDMNRSTMLLILIKNDFNESSILPFILRLTSIEMLVVFPSRIP